MGRFWGADNESLFDRPIGNEPPKKKIYIAFEGDVTEPDYFYDFIDSNKESNKYLVEICPLLRYTGDSSSHPYHVRDGMIDYYKTSLEGELFDKTKDQLWIVIDIDKHFINGTQSEEQTYRSYLESLEIDGVEIRAAVSKPCFELWLILHHVDCCSLNLDQIYLNKTKKVRDGNNNMIKTTYIKDLWYCTKKNNGTSNLIGKLDYAIENARNPMLQQNILEMTKSPGTLLYKLFESMN